MYTLQIGNKNYSSWSLRPWVLLRTLAIPFKEQSHRFGPTFNVKEAGLSPSGRVPALHDGKRIVWDSLAIAEYLAERHPGVWPADDDARAWARCAAAEMHSAFAELRNECSMSCGMRMTLKSQSDALKADIARLVELWTDGIQRYGGPFLAGKAFTAVDAFYAPVAFRVQSYGLQLPAIPAAYVKALLALPSMKEWYEAALAEDFRDEAHELEIAGKGTITADLRVPAKG